MKLRGQIDRFSGELSAGLGKVGARFVRETIYGPLTGGSVRLTEIARALDEQIPLKKTHWRLCRNLADRNTAEVVATAVLKSGANHVQENTLLVVDPSDLRREIRTVDGEPGPSSGCQRR
ncbi:MAG: hypothetical protein CME06_16680 [Gemmatimonadetes bacterium]|nr:hypothetical protein [Gemmatimonadota bacterium]